MASSPPPSFSLYPSLERLFTWFAGQPPVRRGCAADASMLSGRHERSEERILETSKSCSDAGFEQHAEEGETMSQDSRSSPVSSLLPCFILDSGACRHAVGDESLLSKQFTTRFPAAGMATTTTTYKARDGRELTVSWVGAISCWDKFHLPNVLFVPGLPAGVVLVSVQQLAEEHGYVAMFGGGRCSVKDPSSGEIVGKGRLHDDGLYHLEFLNILADAAVD